MNKEQLEEIKKEVIQELKEELKKELGNDIRRELNLPIVEEPAQSVNEDQTKSESEKVEEVKTESEKTEDGKNLSKFGLGLIIYAAVWIVVTVIVCIKLWSSLAGYQRNFDAAEAAANPDLYVGQYVDLFSKENIRNTAGENWAGVSPYETEENWNSFVNTILEDGSVSYNRIEGTSNTNPKYDVTVDGKVIGFIALREAGETDKYGFHSYELKEATVLAELPQLESITVSTLPGNDVMVNGIDIASAEVPQNVAVSDSMHDQASERSTVSFSKDEYVLDGFIALPEVSITGSEGKTVTLDPDENNEYKMYDAYTEAFRNAVEPGCIAAGEEYTKVMNVVDGIDKFAAYAVTTGPAYAAVQSALAAIYYAGKPDEFEITGSELLELWRYDEYNMVATTHHTMHRLYRGVEYDEEMTIEALFIFNGSKWLIQDMTFKR